MRGNKYNARAIRDSDGYFSSLGEWRRWQGLKLMQRGDLISLLERQPLIKFPAGDPPITYRPDFKYYDPMVEKMVWEDFKGVETMRFKLICLLWAQFGPGELRITKMCRGRCVVTRSIFPNQKK